MSDTAPLVSIIIATYNWSSVLRYALQSVLGQTFASYELLVIGDGCTDDSADVVAAANDPRIRWHNLPRNSGNQSLPNNTGMEMARGKCIAYHGHDDIWHPSHLERLAQAMQGGDYDLGHTLCAMIGPGDSGMRILCGMFKSGSFGPDDALPPTSIMHTRSAAQALGGWKDYRTCSLPPDREFISRLRTLRHRVVAVNELTVFKFNAAWRKNCYREKPSHEQADYLHRMRTEPDFIAKEWLAITRAYAFGNTKPPFKAQGPRNLADAPPGSIIEQWRRERGLEPNEMPDSPRRPLGRQLVKKSKRGLRRMFQSLARRLED